jgi:hypothetical protein
MKPRKGIILQESHYLQSVNFEGENSFPGVVPFVSIIGIVIRGEVFELPGSLVLHHTVCVPDDPFYPTTIIADRIPSLSGLLCFNLRHL